MFVSDKKIMDREIEFLMNRLPNTPEAKRLRGYTAAKLAFEKYKDIECGKRYVLMYLQERPNNRPALLLMGDICFANRDYTESFNYYKKIYELNYAQNEILLKICTSLYHMLHITQNQRIWLEKAQEFYPNHEIIIKLKDKFNNLYNEGLSDEFYDTNINLDSPEKPKMTEQKFDLSSFITPSNPETNKPPKSNKISLSPFYASTAVKNGKGSTGLFGRSLFKASFDKEMDKLNEITSPNTIKQKGDFTSMQIKDKNSDLPRESLKPLSSPSINPNQAIIPITPGNIVINLVTGLDGIQPMYTPLHLSQENTRDYVDANLHATTTNSTLQKSKSTTKPISKSKTTHDEIDVPSPLGGNVLNFLTSTLENNQDLLAKLTNEHKNALQINVLLAKTVEENTTISKSLFEYLNVIKENQMSLKMEVENVKLAFAQMSLYANYNNAPTANFLTNFPAPNPFQARSSNSFLHNTQQLQQLLQQQRPWGYYDEVQQQIPPSSYPPGPNFATLTQPRPIFSAHHPPLTTLDGTIYGPPPPPAFNYAHPAATSFSQFAVTNHYAQPLSPIKTTGGGENNNLLRFTASSKTAVTFSFGSPTLATGSTSLGGFRFGASRIATVTTASTTISLPLSTAALTVFSASVGPLSPGPKTTYQRQDEGNVTPLTTAATTSHTTTSDDLDESDTTSNSSKSDGALQRTYDTEDEKDEYDEERDTPDNEINNGPDGSKIKMEFKLPESFKGIICQTCYVTNKFGATNCIACESPLVMPATTIKSKIPGHSKTLTAVKQELTTEKTTGDFKIPSSFTFAFNPISTLSGSATSVIPTTNIFKFSMSMPPPSISTTTVGFGFKPPQSIISSGSHTNSHSGIFSTGSFLSNNLFNAPVGAGTFFKSPHTPSRMFDTEDGQQSPPSPFSMTNYSKTAGHHEDDEIGSPTYHNSSGNQKKEMNMEEEGSNILFAERAKLYRFDTETKEWKERGTGFLKILEPSSIDGDGNSPNTAALRDKIGSPKNNIKKRRIILRRDHVFKLAANHYIPPNVKLIPVGTKNGNTVNVTNYSWHALDFASPENIESAVGSKRGDSFTEIPAETGKNELFTVKFKTPEIASEFKRIFESSYSQLPVTEEPSVPLTENKIAEDECAIISDNKPSPNLVQKALNLKMSPYFFDYLDKSPSHPFDPHCAGCKGEESPSKSPIVPTQTPTPTLLSGVKASGGTAPIEFKFAPVKSEIIKDTGVSPKSESSVQVNTTGSPKFVGNRLIQIDLEGILIDKPTGEQILFNEKAKIYRFDNDTSEWKERGIGQMLILHHPGPAAQNFTRLLFRREQIFKTACNHRIDSTIKLSPGKKFTWCWRAFDFSEEHHNLDESADAISKEHIKDAVTNKGSEEKFTVRFKTQEISQAFHDIVEDVKNNKTLVPLRSNDLNEVPDPSQSRPRAPSECYENEIQKQMSPKQTITNESMQTIFKPFGNTISDAKTSLHQSTTNAPLFPINSNTFALKSDLLSNLNLVDHGITNRSVATGTDKCFGNLGDFINSLPSLTTADENASSSSIVSAKPTISLAASPTFNVNLSTITTNSTTNTTSFSNTSSSFFGTSKLSLNFGVSKLTSDTKISVSSPPQVKSSAASITTSLPITFNLGSLNEIAEQNRKNYPDGPMSATFSSSQSSNYSILGAPPIFGTSTRNMENTLTPSLQGQQLQQPSMIPKPGFFGSSTVVSTVVPFSTTSSPAPPIFGSSTFGKFGASNDSSLGIFDTALQNLNDPSIFNTRSEDRLNFTLPDNGGDSVIFTKQTQEFVVKPFLFDPKSMANKAGMFSNPELYKPAPLFTGGHHHTNDSLNKTKDSKKFGENDSDQDNETTAVNEETLEEDGTKFIIYAPIVDLVPVITGEEDESSLFDQRAKLYRFDSDTKEWKEKGIGQFKILESVNPDGLKKHRFLMRREKIHKVCCNHWITPNLNFQPFPNDHKGNSISWNAIDYSDPTADDAAPTTSDGSNPSAVPGKHEFFTLRFKNKDIVDSFKNITAKLQKEDSDGHTQ